MSKYNNIDIFPVIKNYNKNVYEFLKAFNTGICLADDILDHKIHTDYIVELMACMFDSMNYLDKGLLIKINPLIKEIIEGEKLNLTYVPKQNDIELELNNLFKRSALMKLYFECLCYVDQSFDTKGNRAWIEKFAKSGLIYNDAKGLVEGDFEDLIQGRRNYVLLTKFTPDIYYSWRTLKDDIMQAAKEVLNEVALEQPKDKRLEMIRGEYA